MDLHKAKDCSCKSGSEEESLVIRWQGAGGGRGAGNAERNSRKVVREGGAGKAIVATATAKLVIAN